MTKLQIQQHRKTKQDPGCPQKNRSLNPLVAATSVGKLM